MNKTEIEDIKQTINWLLENGDFKDTETAYNIAMNSINRLDEAINFTDNSLQLKEKETLTFEEYVKNEKIEKIGLVKYIDRKRYNVSLAELKRRYKRYKSNL